MSACLTLLLLLFSTAGAMADEPLPGRSDFAWGMGLELGETQPLYRLRLPLEVYEGVVRSDLGDLRVLNGQGGVVPQQLVLPADERSRGERVEAKIFPLYGDREAELESILIQLPGSGKSDLRISTQEPNRAEEEILRGYILQLDNEPPRPLDNLELSWRAEARGFVHRLKVEYGGDLEHWRILNPAAVIADLRYQGERLRKPTIPLRGIKAKYLRLSAPKGSRLIDLVDAKVESTGEIKHSEPNRLSLGEIASGERAGEYLFELPGPLVAVSMDIIPVEMNTLLRATLFSRDDPERPWTRRGDGLIYKLMAEGEPLQRTNLPVERTQDRYWKLRVDTSGGGFGAAAPALLLNWTPHALVFAARGEPPFTLAFGSGRVGPVVGGQLLSRLDEGMRELISDKVYPSARGELAGPEVLSPKVEVDWKRWLLWGVLVLGSVVLVWMAWSTLRQLND